MAENLELFMTFLPAKSITYRRTNSYGTSNS